MEEGVEKWRMGGENDARPAGLERQRRETPSGTEGESN